MITKHKMIIWKHAFIFYIFQFIISNYSTDFKYHIFIFMELSYFRLAWKYINSGPLSRSNAPQIWDSSSVPCTLQSVFRVTPVHFQLADHYVKEPSWVVSLSCRNMVLNGQKGCPAPNSQNMEAQNFAWTPRHLWTRSRFFNWLLIGQLLEIAFFVLFGSMEKLSK